MIPPEDRFEFVSFDTENGDYPGADVSNWFDGANHLEDAGTFLCCLNASFASRALAWDWMVKSYKGADTAGVGVVIDGEPIQ